ncbi:MAG: hypothetical protein WBW41_10700 [Verrucomicrobiia bacterium]
MISPSCQPSAGEKLTLPAFGVIESERVLAADNLFAVVSDKLMGVACVAVARQVEASTPPGCSAARSVWI